MACPLVISTTAREASCGTNLELHLRRLGSGRSGVEVGVTRRKSAPRSDQTAGKLPDLRVVRLHSVVVPLPLDGNPVLGSRSEEHTSELQSLRHRVCRLLLEKQKK